MIPSRTPRRRWLAGAFAVAVLASAPAIGRAGVVTREQLAGWFPPPFVVGEREADPPVWPILRRSGPPTFSTELAGYLFESIDLAPIPGFSGTPVNLLVAIDPAGTFLDVRVLSQREPVFVGGLGEEPLVRFVGQYRGLDLRHSVKISSGSAAGSAAARGGSSHVHLDGVAKATASLRIVNHTILAAALRVARAKLGFTGVRDPDLVARVREDLFEPATFEELEEEGLVQRRVLLHREVERSFAGGDGAGLDPEALAAPDAPFVTLWAALATVPTAGRNLLDDAGWRTLTGRVDPGDHVLLVMWRGRYGVVDEEFVRGSVPDRLSLSQGGLALELRDLDLDSGLRPADVPGVDGWRAFRVIAQAGLDPGAPMKLTLRVTRARGFIRPEPLARDFSFDVRVPERWLVPAVDDEKGWWAAWKARRVELAVLVAALALLGAGLAWPRSPLARARTLRWARPLFLVFTLGFLGWYAQAQLSIVNVTAVLQAAAAGRSLAFFLQDPLSTVLWAFVLVTLVVWGRGTFCGWLCPFGALQELVARVARFARVPAVRLRRERDRALKRVKYGVLAVVLAAAAAPAAWGDAALEVEPFKTAITLSFARTWPFVAWAAGLVVAGAIVEKAFCRYLCPLGALLALGARARRRDWIPRRAECGRPCQTCRHRCAYQAIEPDGRIDYPECFQCMDCVAVYGSDALCTPRLLAARAGRREP